MDWSTFTASPALSALAGQLLHLQVMPQLEDHQASQGEIMARLEELRLHLVHLDQRVEKGFEDCQQDFHHIDNRMGEMTEGTREVVGHMINIEQMLGKM
jgi:hypothetical protein